MQAINDSTHPALVLDAIAVFVCAPQAVSVVIGKSRLSTLHDEGTPRRHALDFDVLEYRLQTLADLEPNRGRCPGRLWHLDMQILHNEAVGAERPQRNRVCTGFGITRVWSVKRTVSVAASMDSIRCSSRRGILCEDRGTRIHSMKSETTCRLQGRRRYQAR